ncbi:MAG: ABC transporter permease [Gammaproteobacteria bacterium]|nr:MAG: ABC transporter permease [Gammaproteobacteria bacterium]
MPYNEQLIAYKTILIKEVLRFSRIWVQTILPPVITTVLYLLIFGNLIGSKIGMMDGHSYIDFIIPGLILMTVITNSYANAVSSFYSAKFQRHIEELLVSPMPNYIILLGFISGAVARGMIVAVAVTITCAFFTDMQFEHFFIILFSCFFTSALFATAGVINAIYAKTFDDISIIPVFVLTPLTYLGGIFYSIKMLPDFWQQISVFNPVLHMINLFRYGFLGVSDTNILYAFLFVVLVLIILLSWAMILLNKGIRIKT